MICQEKRRRELVSDLVNLEWELFRRVSNEGGRASCQSRPGTFEVMRSSQLLTWPLELLESYEWDLMHGMAQGRNLLSEKYAYMMERTSPQEYARLQDQLPVVSVETLEQIESIIAVHLKWEAEARAAYPKLRGRGRPQRSDQDGCGITSVETYLYGELKTYSSKTVQLLLAYTEQVEAEGRNLVLENLEYMVHCYGYPDLEAAEAALAR